jgi:FtsP/CotA-like multicopper oxidase with cupredoxin domain
LQGPTAPLRVKPGQLDVTFRNSLSTPVVVDWRGLDGAFAAEPLLQAGPTAPGAQGGLVVPLRRPGTLFCDLRLSPGARPSRPLPVIVEESDPIFVDRDEVLLIEDWRLRLDGTPAEAEGEVGDAAPTFTANGQILPTLSIRPGERLRLRFINGCEQQVIAVKIEGHEVLIVAIDGTPAEPFLARNGALALAPGGRTDALIDAPAQPDSTSTILVHDGRDARPLARLLTTSEPPVPARPPPARRSLAPEGLPARLDLRGAARVDLVLQGPEWMSPASFSGLTKPAVKVQAGRAVVLALRNQTEDASGFHLHGHHFRLLDRLDDGWKPFWLDTLVVEPKQTERIAFLAEFSGRWLLESVAVRWGAPRLLRWYAVQ